jgi:hypothetical protein
VEESLVDIGATVMGRVPGELHGPQVRHAPQSGVLRQPPPPRGSRAPRAPEERRVISVHTC